MRGRVPGVPDAELAGLERRVGRALRGDGADPPEVLGYGEVSCALALRGDGFAAACKRLPPFPSDEAFQAYRTCFRDQLEAFEAYGIPVLASELRRVAADGAAPVAYCLQPLLAPEALLPRRLASGAGSGPVGQVLDRTLGYLSSQRGLDAQLSNWSEADGELVYLDVTTPLLRDEAGRERLDVDVFLASLPWALRGAVRRLALRGILDRYYSPRSVVVDLLGNLIKEGLAARLPELTALASERLGEPVNLDEVRRYYAADARTWRLLQAVRRLDRQWQRRVRRRPYPFLLPGPVQRHV